MALLVEQGTFGCDLVLHENPPSPVW
jgi:hypothetical protein